jgi:hypothetical protein
MATWTTVRTLRILDFDIENRPLTYAGNDFTFSENTAIAWKFIGDKGQPQVAALGEVDGEEMLCAFLDAYNAADMVVGHNIIKHDLRLINGANLEFGRPPLASMLVHDTYMHLKKKGGISGSQESLAEMLGIEAPKVGMSQFKWRDANRLTADGIAKTKLRAVGDVVQNIEMRQRLMEMDWLNPPTVWRA